VRSRDLSGFVRRKPARAALTGLVWLVACLNPRPEELPSNASSSVGPGVAETGNGTGDGATAHDDATGTESNVAGEPSSPEGSASDMNPPQSPALAPSEPSDAGAPAVSDAGSDAG
jgi:hypothetical protein